MDMDLKPTYNRKGEVGGILDTQMQNAAEIQPRVINGEWVLSLQNIAKLAAGILGTNKGDARLVSTNSDTSSATPSLDGADTDESEGLEGRVTKAGAQLDTPLFDEETAPFLPKLINRIEQLYVKQALGQG